MVNKLVSIIIAFLMFDKTPKLKILFFGGFRIMSGIGSLEMYISQRNLYSFQVARKLLSKSFILLRSITYHPLLALSPLW